MLSKALRASSRRGVASRLDDIEAARQSIHNRFVARWPNAVAPAAAAPVSSDKLAAASTGKKIDDYLQAARERLHSRFHARFIPTDGSANFCGSEEILHARFAARQRSIAKGHGGNHLEAARMRLHARFVAKFGKQQDEQMRLGHSPQIQEIFDSWKPAQDKNSAGELPAAPTDAKPNVVVLPC